jgi:hypothetical protein
MGKLRQESEIKRDLFDFRNFVGAVSLRLFAPLRIALLLSDNIAYPQPRHLKSSSLTLPGEHMQIILAIFANPVMRKADGSITFL